MQQQREDGYGGRTWLAAGLLAVALATPAGAAHISASWSGTGAWSDPTRWSSNPRVPDNGGGDTFDVTLNGGTATLDLDVQIQALSQGGGTITGGFDLDLDDVFTWTGGTQSGTGTTTASAGIDLRGNSSKTTDGRNVNLAGSSTHRGGSWFLRGGAAVTQSGSYVADSGLPGGSGSTLSISPSTGGGSFTNLGTFTQQGSQRTNLSVVFDNAGGSVLVQDGELSLAGGGASTGGTWSVTGGSLLLNSALTFDATSNVSGGGEVVFDSGTATVSGGYAVGATRTQGGTGVLQAGGTTGSLDLNDGILEVAGGTLTATGDLTWLADDLTGAGTTVVQGDAELRGNVSKELDAHQLRLEGTTTHRASTLLLRDGATLTQVGSWVSDSDSGAGGSGSTLSITGTGSGPNRFLNQGTFTQQGTQRTSVSAQFENTGSVVVQAGILAVNTGLTQTVGQTLLAGGELESGTGVDIQGGSLGGEGLVDADILMDGVL
ncbi:MAG: hypothetical protein ACR2P8_00600, partial [Myxococcota bacterium]